MGLLEKLKRKQLKSKARAELRERKEHKRKIERLERSSRLHKVKADIESQKARQRSAKKSARGVKVLNPVGGKKIKSKKAVPWYDRLG